jgi:hypothetical protein
MSDIRLRKITIENGPLIIQYGTINITNTNVSLNKISGALVSDGGIAINCTADSTSSTSGGALTIGGGMSVRSQTFLGDNLTIDNNTSSFIVKGITTNRLSLDSTQFYLSPNGINTRFTLNDTNALFNITTGSSSSTTGSLVVNGGLSINCTTDSSSASAGGAVTISGGVAIGANTNIAKSLTIGESYSSNSGLVVRYTGNSQIALNNSSNSSSTTLNMVNNDLFLNNSTGNIYISSNNTIIKSTLCTFDTTTTFTKYISILDTIESMSSTIGSLVVKGGISITCSTDAMSTTAGGSLTIAGGLAINKKTFTGDSLGLQISTSSKPNKLVLYQSSQDLSETINFTGLGTTIGSLLYQVQNTSGCHTFYAGTSEVFRVKGSNEVQFIGNSQKYSIIGGGKTSNSLSLQGQSSYTDTSLDLFTMDGLISNSNSVKIFGVGLPNLTSDSEYINIGWNSTKGNYTVSTINSGTGIQRNLEMYSSNNSEQLLLNTSGTITMKSSSTSSNSSTGALYLTGGLSINCSSNVSSVSNGGALTVAGGASFGKNVVVSNTLILNVNNTIGDVNILGNSLGVLKISSPNNKTTFASNNTSSSFDSNIGIYSLNNNTLGNYSLFEMNSDINYSIKSLAAGSGLQKAILFNAIGDITSQIYLSTYGNIGIYTTSPNYNLDINGNFNVSEFSYINGLNVSSTNNATNLTTASLTVSGGVAIKKDLLLDGKVNSFDITSCSNSSTGSVVLAGGLSINCFTNATTVSNGGALTVAGGASIAGDLIVGGNISYANAAQASNTYAYLTLTASDPSDDIANGALVTFGGVSIQSTFNATSSSSGGGITVAGGAAIGADLYVHNNIYSGGTSTYYGNTASNIINFYDLSNIERFSIDLNLSNNNYAVSRYNSLGFLENSFTISNATGMTVFNNTTASTNSNNGCISAAGGIGIQSTKDATQLGNGGGLTVSGGASISKKLFVGGDTVFSSTSVSYNYTTGSVIIAGGAGIGGNLNINGSTIISGDLTVIGTTTTIESQNTILSDNILLLNSGPAGTADSGFLIQRYQQANDSNSGDVVSDAAYLSDTIPNQSGMASNQIKFSTNTSPADDYYNGWWIKIVSGMSAGQIRQITGYIGLTRVATLASNFTNQNPSITENVLLYNKPYVGIIFNETNNRFEFGASASNSLTTVSLTDTLPIYFSSAQSTSTQPSISSSSGSLIMSGGLSTACLTDAVSITSGGALTVAGGASIAKKMYIGTGLTVNGVNMTPNTADIYSTVAYNALNNTTADITGLVFDSNVWSFDIYLAVQVVATANNYSNYHIRGVNKGTTWELVTSYVGDPTTSFNINNSGQITYTTNNFIGFISGTFKYKVVTN